MTTKKKYRIDLDQKKRQKYHQADNYYRSNGFVFSDNLEDWGLKPEKKEK